MAWIKMRTNLDSDPRVIAMASELNTTELHVVGCLWKVWSWADSHTNDGQQIRIQAATIDRFVSLAGFAAALRNVGWLEGRDNSLSFPRFVEHNGQTAKRRCDTQARVAKFRGNKKTLQEKQYLAPALKKRIAERDGHACVYCGRKKGQVHPTEYPSYGELALDHVIPESRGGDTNDANLVLACGKCNSIKGDRTPDECGFRWPVDETGARYGCNKNALPEKIREEKNKSSKDDLGETTKPRFVQPTVEEVADYCADRCNNVSPQKFVDHYTARGWMIGKNKMKDWKAAVRTWEQNNYQSGTTQQTLIVEGISGDA